MLSQQVLELAHAELSRERSHSYGRDRNACYMHSLPNRAGAPRQYHGNQGSFEYYLVGDDMSDDPKSDIWEGGCFAAWDTIPREFMLTSISYRMPLTLLDMPRNAGRVLRQGWNDVIQPVFGADNLPSYEHMRRRVWLRFGDTVGRSLMEASLYFRLTRSFRECISYPWTCGLLRNRYPEASAPVLLALTSMGHCNMDGLTWHYHPTGSNTHIGGSFNIQQCLSLLRNWTWAEENGGWRVDKLRLATDTANPFSRRYYGHNHVWFGVGDHFQVEVQSDGQTMQHLAGSYQWKQSCPEMVGDWSKVDDLVELFKHVYEDTQGTDPLQTLSYDVHEMLPWVNTDHVQERTF